MSSILTIKITSDGDYTIKNPIPFTPNMVGLKNVGYTLYFPPTIKLTKSLFNYILPDEDIISILTSPSLFSTFIKQVIKSDYQKFRKLSLKEAYEKGIVFHNMKFYKELFFNKRKIYFNGVAFTIRKSNIINNLIVAPTTLPAPLGSGRNLNYEMVVHLSVIKTTRATKMNLMRENCKDKAKRIDDISSELFGRKLGLYYEDTDVTLKDLLPAMYTSPETGYTTEPLPSKTVLQQPYRQPYQLPYQLPYQIPYRQPFQQPYQQPYQIPYRQPFQQPYQQPYQLPYQLPYQPVYRSERERAMLNSRQRARNLRGGKTKKHNKGNKKIKKTLKNKKL
jgi:hypothetical protein